MKNKLIMFLPIYILMMITFIKVDAAPTTAVYESPEATEKGQYITLSHKLDTSVQIVEIRYTAGSNLLLVGFNSVPGVSCTYNGYDSIRCESSTGIPTNSIFVYPIFKITNTFTTDQNLTSTFILNGSQNPIATKINGVAKKIEVTNIEVNENEKEMYAGDSFQLEVTVLPENATNKTIAYTSSDSEIITVNETGLVTAVKEGNATVTIVSGNVKKIVNIKVKPQEVELKSIITENNMTLKVAESKPINIAFDPENTTVDTSVLTYESSNDKFATVNYEGRVIGISKGTATITIRVGDVSTSFEVVVEEDESHTSTKKSGNAAGYIIAVVVSVLLTLGVMFVIKTIKNKKDLDNEDNNDEEQLNRYI